MTFQELLNSRVFFRILLKNDVFFDSIKEKFPEIFADLISSRNNPNCYCKTKVKIYLQARLSREADYFNNLINIDEIKKLIEQNAEEIKSPKPRRNQMEKHMQMIQQSRGGRVFEIGKTEEDWKALVKKLNSENVFFKSFSILEKPDKLVVYFI